MNYHIECIAYPACKNPDLHEQYKPPAFESRERPVPVGVEIVSEDMHINKEEESPLITHNNEKTATTIKEFYDFFIYRTQKQCDDESEYAQQSSNWLKSRHYCITASQFGSAIGVSPYQSPDDLINEKLFKSFKGNPSTEYGNQHEGHAREVFIEWLKNKLEKENFININFIEMNLLKFEACPWVGVSPDGIVSYENKNGEKFWDLIEYKCPARFKPNENPYLKFKFGVPPQYMAQIQGIMGFLNLYSKMQFKRCWFVVWTPTQSFMNEVMFHNDYFIELKLKLQTWYFEKFLPMIFSKYKNNLPKSITI